MMQNCRKIHSWRGCDAQCLEAIRFRAKIEVFVGAVGLLVVLFLAFGVCR